MNIYIANLNYKIQDDELRQVFEEYGEVSSAKVIKDHETGRSRGFGFVEMPDDEEAQNAIDNLHETDLKGKKLIVNKARPRQNTGGGGESRGGFRPNNNGGDRFNRR